MSTIVRKLRLASVSGCSAYLQKSFALISLSIFFTSYASLSHSHSNFSFKNIHISDGLPSNQVIKIYQQKNGLIWIGTDKGAARFDGKNFKQYLYAPGSNTHISNNYVTDIVEDIEGNVWLATEDGLNRISPTGKNKIFKKGQNGLEIVTSWFTSLLIDDQQILWVGTSSGLFKFSPTNEQFELVTATAFSDSQTPVNSIYQHPNGQLFIATSEGIFILERDLFALEKLSLQGIDSEDKVEVNSVHSAGNESVWIGTSEKGLINYNFQNKSVSTLVQQNEKLNLSSSTVTRIVSDLEGNLWVGHVNNGVLRISSEGRYMGSAGFKAFTPTALPSSEINDLFIDDSGILWIATTGGLSVLSPLRAPVTVFRQEYDQKGLSSNSVYALHYDGNSILWSGGDRGVNSLDLKNNKITSYPLKDSLGEILPNQTVWHIEAADEKRLWLTTEKGLLLFDTDTGRTSNVTKNIEELSGELYTILPIDKESVWLTGYKDVGLILFNKKDGIRKRFLHTDESPYKKGGNFTMQKLIDSSGNIWMATTDSVVKVNPESGETIYYSLSNDQSYIRATGIGQDDLHRIWVTTQGSGLVRFEARESGTEMNFFQQDSGIAENELMSLTINDDTIWITSFDKLISFNINENKSTVFANLIEEKNLNFMESAAVMINEELYLGSNRGIIKVNTSTLKLNDYQPNVLISEVKMDNKVLSGVFDKNHLNTYHTDYNNNDMEFSFAALDYDKPDNNKYQFKLEGHDEAWSSPTLENSVRYTNLPPGKYTFLVKGSNSDGIWSEQYARFSFIVDRPWWYWVIIALVFVIAMVGCFYLVDKRRQWRYLYSKAHTDSLTGLANRHTLNQSLQKETLSLENRFSLLSIDLDGFKDVNDTFGHHIGDLLLGAASSRLSECCRENDLIARLGGDEFAIILRDSESQSSLIDITERVRKTLSKEFSFGNKRIAISSSIGAATFPDDANNGNDLMSRADAAMYSAKKRGKNNVVFYNSELNELLNHRVKIRAYLKSALDSNEMVVYYQPKVDQRTRGIIGFEALLRWRSKEKGWVSPEEFIQEAENTGEIVSIGLWVLDRSFSQIAEWEQRYNLPDDFRISVNISPIQLMQNSFKDDVLNAIRKYKISPTRIELEITESVLIQSRRQCQSVIADLRYIGISVALDDFGVGFSSLSYLNKFPINTLKVDRSFIIELEGCRENQVILRHIFSLAKELKIQVIIEGVETKEQLKILHDLKGFLIQGYYYSKPLEEALANRYLEKVLNNTLSLEQARIE